MLPAVELNYQHAFDAAEVDDVRANGMLPAKLRAQLMSSQAHPEPALGVRLLMTQLPRPITERGSALIA
jgi:hypothetical protein